MRRSTILGTGFCVPDRVVTNDDLAGLMDTSDQWIRERTGIEQQYIDAIRENAQEAQRQLLAEKQAAYAKVRSVSSMTQDLQTLERQLWSSMPSSVKSMLDFSASSGARGS